MAQQIRVSFNDEEYTLEYTRATAKAMEKGGFDINAISSQPNTMIPLLFAGAFLCHHRKVKEETINAIFNKMTNKEALINKLVEMYADTVTTLLEDAEGEQGNASWEVC